MNRDTVANVLRAGFELRREQNIYVDVVKAIEARRPVGVRQGILARKSVSVCLGREGGHWVADITFVNHQTTQSADSPDSWSD